MLIGNDQGHICRLRLLHDPFILLEHLLLFAQLRVLDLALFLNLPLLFKLLQILVYLLHVLRPRTGKIIIDGIVVNRALRVDRSKRRAPLGRDPHHSRLRRRPGRHVVVIVITGGLLMIIISGLQICRRLAVAFVGILVFVLDGLRLRLRLRLLHVGIGL